MGKNSCPMNDDSRGRPAFAEDASGTPNYLAGRIRYMRRMHQRATLGEDVEFSGVHEVESLRSKLVRTRPIERPTLMTVVGTFFPCLLLFPAWWERLSRAERRDIAWRDDLQEWLFYGFEEWGPSWDLSLATGDGGQPDLFAQVGTVDELNSLPVIVTGEQARRLRQELLPAHPVFEAEITGVLTHRSHIQRSEERTRWGKAFDYALVVREDERHAVRYRGTTPTYSAYLWQCWVPDQWFVPDRPPRIDDVYFAWEHTDYTKDGALAYNLDGLRKKAEYLEHRHGPLTLLQKSSWLVEGTPVYPTARFRSFLLDEKPEQELPPPLFEPT